MKLINLIPALLTALGLVVLASTASATSIELQGVKQSGSVTFKTSLKSGTSKLWSDTGGFFINTCTASSEEWATSVFSGTTVSGPISTLTFTSCKEEPVVVDTKGSLTVEHIAGTTNGTVRWIGGKVTTPSPFGALTCVTAASPGTDIGVITGVASGNATFHYSAVVNCPPITGRVTATYTITAPSGYGVTS